MSENKRPYLSAEDKVSAVKHHLLEQIPVSEICDELGVDPNRFYEWQTQLFQNGASALRPDKKVKNLESKVDQLESKLLRKDQVVSELIEELMDSKKKNGEN